MHIKQGKLLTRAAVLAISTLAMSGAAAVLNPPAASASPGAVLASGQCQVELFANPNLTGDLAVAPTNPFAVRAAAEPGNFQMYFDEVHVDLNSTVVTAPGNLSPADIKARANSARVTCTINSVDGGSPGIRILPQINGESVPDIDGNGCDKSEGVAFVPAGGSVVKMFVSNQLSPAVAGQVSDVTFNLSQVLGHTSCP